MVFIFQPGMFHGLWICHPNIYRYLQVYGYLSHWYQIWSEIPVQDVWSTAEIAGHQIAGDADTKKKRPNLKKVPAFNKAFGGSFLESSFNSWNIFSKLSDF